MAMAYSKLRELLSGPLHGPRVPVLEAPRARLAPSPVLLDSSRRCLPIAMASLKRSRSLADFFRPSVSRSPSRRATPSPSPPAGTALTTAAISSPLEADYSPAQPQDPFRSDGSPRPTIDTSQAGVPRSGTQEQLDDIYGAYGDSPTKTRFPSQPERTDSAFTTSSVTTTATRDQIDNMPTLAASNYSTANALSPSSAMTAGPHAGRHPLKISTRSANSSSSSRPQQSRSKSNGELDLIDRLDISGLYGGGGFIRHEGPYAAASGSRSPGGHAPIDAFDPSAFTLSSRPSPAPHPSSSSSTSAVPSSSPAAGRTKASNGLSERAHAALGAMDTLDGALGRERGGPYGAARGASEVSMGFPGKQQDGKSAQLMEIYGFRDAEAWEDYGTARYDPASAAASRDSVLPPGVSKQDRIERTQSIWDIEATLRAGKPVGSAPPPVPVIPAEWSAPDVSPSAKPKRSKSLAARFRAGRKNPNNPIMDGNDSAGSGAEDGREAGVARSQPVTPVEDRRGARELPLVTPLSTSVGPSYRSPHSAVEPRSGNGAGEVDRLSERTSAIKFDETYAERERSSEMVRAASAPGGSGAGEGEKKSKSGLKRLFSTKRKS